MSKRMQKSSRQSSLQAAVWLIGLGILFLTDSIWPGILILIGISMLTGTISGFKNKPDIIDEEDWDWEEIDENDLPGETPFSPPPPEPKPFTSEPPPAADLPANCPWCGAPVSAQSGTNCSFCNAKLTG
jgi:hypothetical protein